MESLLIPKPQPNFPLEDVNEANAALFGQLLYEPTFVEAAHDLAEQNIIGFKIGHQTLRSLSYALYMDYTQQNAFSYGATVYEALSVAVRPTFQEQPNPLALRAKTAEILALPGDAFSAAITMRDHEERLLDEAPATSKLIIAASDLQPQMDRRFVLMGAAMERDIDRDLLDVAA